MEIKIIKALPEKMKTKPTMNQSSVLAKYLPTTCLP